MKTPSRGNSTSKSQSSQIRRVLESKEFLAWTPYESVGFDLKASSNLTLGFIFSCGISAILLFGIQGSSRDFSTWMPTLFSLLGGTFFLYIILFGIGGSRSIEFNKSSFEISSNSGMPLRCPWDEVISVRRVWIGGYEIRTRRGRATVWWWILPLWEDGYNRYLYEVFKALANGYDKSKLKRYRPPVSLKNDGNYLYEIPVNIQTVILVVEAVASISLAIASFLTSSKPLTALAVGSFGKSCLSFGKFIKNYKPAEYVTGDKVIISEGQIVVIGKKGTERAPFQLIGNELVPCISPYPFQGAEVYGDHGNTISIDRRLLMRVHHPLQPPKKGRLPRSGSRPSNAHQLRAGLNQI